jgi:hypothetical protein
MKARIVAWLYQYAVSAMLKRVPELLNPEVLKFSDVEVTPCQSVSLEDASLGTLVGNYPREPSHSAEMRLSATLSQLPVASERPFSLQWRADLVSTSQLVSLCTIARMDKQTNRPAELRR